MKKLNELKQYLEKELHARRFLAEAIEDIKDLENLNALSQRLKKAVEIGTADSKAMHEELKAVNEKVAKAKADLSVVESQADEIINAAKNKAAALVAEAKEKVQELDEKSKDEYDEHVKKLNGLKTKIKTTEIEADVVVAKKKAAEDELAKLRKKLEG